MIHDVPIIYLHYKYEVCILLYIHVHAGIYVPVYSVTGLPINFFTEKEKLTFSVTNELYTTPSKAYSQVDNTYLHT